MLRELKVWCLANNLRTQRTLILRERPPSVKELILCLSSRQGPNGFLVMPGAQTLMEVQFLKPFFALSEVKKYDNQINKLIARHYVPL